MADRAAEEIPNSDDSYQSELVPINKVLVMNKVDLVTNRRKFNHLRQELEDIGKFDHIVNVSATTGFGIEEVKYHKSKL